MSNHKKIQALLNTYNPNNSTSLASEHFAKHELTMLWYITSICNFNCPYCSDHSNEYPNTYKYSPKEITKRFDEKNNTWHIILTGGEPFLHNHIIELCSLLSRKHYLSINTNLSTNNIADFANQINPDKIIAINASIHILSRNNNSLDKYIKNFLLLQDKGFNIIGSYVVYPSLINQFESDILKLKKLGLKQISSKAYIGTYNNKRYPAAYSDEEKKRIFETMSNEVDMPEYHRYKFFKGLKCSTGRKMISIRPDGEIERCMSDSTSLGNFFSGNYSLYKKDVKCKAKECLCPYQGMLFAKNRHWIKKNIKKR